MADLKLETVACFSVRSLIWFEKLFHTYRQITDISNFYYLLVLLAWTLWSNYYFGLGVGLVWGWGSPCYKPSSFWFLQNQYWWTNEYFNQWRIQREAHLAHAPFFRNPNLCTVQKCAIILPKNLATNPCHQMPSSAPSMSKLLGEFTTLPIPPSWINGA